jgi:hypothetical protein
MDMSVSPDLEAFCCYGLVLVLGLVAGRVQITNKLENLPGKWIMVNTWLLFFAYSLIPVALFWFLDRTNAIHDTSFFAAFLVGAGYQQLLTGKIGSIGAPGEISRFWQPFGAWADRIAVSIRDRVATHSTLFDEKLLYSIRTDQQRCDCLKQIAMAHTADPAALDQQLRAIESQAGILGAEAVHDKQSSLLYRNLKMSSPQIFEYLLHKNNVIPAKWYWWYAKEGRSKVTAGAVAMLLLVLVIASVHILNTPAHFAQYYVWRVHKSNGTDYDRYRARNKLANFLQRAPSAYSDLAVVLTIPNLPVNTADSVLSLLLASRHDAAAHNVQLESVLADSLRTENSDIRSRIQKVLLYLANERHANVPKDLDEWRPDPKETPTDIDARIKEWHGVANSPPPPLASP